MKQSVLKVGRLNCSRLESTSYSWLQGHKLAFLRTNWRECSTLCSTLFAVITLLFCALPSFAQSVPDEPRPQIKTHKLFDSKNLVSLSALAVVTAGDGYTTRDLLTTPGFRESNPTWRPFTRTTAGTATIASLSFASTIAMMATAHHFEESRPHHRRIWHVIERVTPLVAVGLETRAFAHNLQQPSLQPPTTICQNSGCMVGKL